MNKLLAILALTALSCATSRARVEKCPTQEQPGIEEQMKARGCTPWPNAKGVWVCPAAARPVPVLPPLPAPPLAPSLDKVPPGCGPAFLECLTPKEDAKLKAYYQAVKDWSVQVYRLGCSRGR